MTNGRGVGKGGGPGPAAPARRAFLAAQYVDRTWVVDLPHGKPAAVGRSPHAWVGADDPSIAERHAVLTWDGAHLWLEPGPERPPIHVNGKRLEGTAELRLGDEVTCGALQLVVGITIPPDASGRRVLTHDEFRERVWEEVARATRSRRPTALAILRVRAGDGRQVAARALAGFRAGDVVGSFAEDELEILLPDTPRDAGAAVLARLLDASGARDAATGLAVFPDDADGPERLLRMALDAAGAAQGQRAAAWRTPAAPEVHAPATSALVAQLERLAGEAGPLVLAGEPHVGKSVFARVLHGLGPRSSGPFRRVACGATRSEARSLAARLPALWAEARGGTLLLDEAQALDAGDQAALAAWLEARPSDDVRVVWSVARRVEALRGRSAFVDALADALEGAPIVEVPPLRERPEDIIPLARRFGAETAGRPVRLTPGALARLRSYPWFGNVLELRNAMERAVRVAHGGDILAEHLPSEVLPASSNEGTLREHVDGVERDAIVRALADANHNQTHAARRLGLSRRALIYKMEKYGLKPPPGAVRR